LFLSFQNMINGVNKEPRFMFGGSEHPAQERLQKVLWGIGLYDK